MEAEEEEALRNHCRKMISRVRNKEQQHLQSSEGERRTRTRRRRRTDRETQVVAGDEFGDHRECNLPLPDCTPQETDQTSPNLMCQGPEVQTVPPQLISMLRLKTFKEEMRRAAEVELHDPAVCNVCEQEQASLALKSFIRRKKTQLQFQTLKGRLNTHPSLWRVSASGEFGSQSPSMPLTGFREELLGGDVRVTATWGCLGND